MLLKFSKNDKNEKGEKKRMGKKKLPQNFNEILDWKIPEGFISYRVSRFRQANGKIRKLEIPNEDLAKVQKKISKYLSKAYTPCLNMAFRNEHNYFNAAMIILKGLEASSLPLLDLTEPPVFYRVDIKDFFANTTPTMFKTEMEIRGFRSKNIKKLIDLCFWKRHLPTGAPSSPVVSSIASDHLDRRLVCALLPHKATRVARFADDYFILFPNDSSFKSCVGVINYIINDYGYKINKDKTRKININSHLKVMGIVGSFQKDGNLQISLSRKKRNEILHKLNNSNQVIKDGYLAWLNSLTTPLYSPGMKKFMVEVGIPIRKDL